MLAGLQSGHATILVRLDGYPKDSYRLCYVRGPEGIIVELAEQIG